MQRSIRGQRLVTVLIAGLLAVSVPTAAGARVGPEASHDRARAATRSDAGDWMRRLPGGRPGVGTLEIRLDRILADVGDDGSLVVDRDALVAVLQEVIGEDSPLETMQLGELLDRLRRVQVSFRGLSVELDRKELTDLARQFLGGAVPVEEIRIGELLDRLPGSTTVAEPSLLGVIRGMLGQVERVDPYRDPRRRQRHALRRQYAGVLELLRQVRRDGAGYDEAFRRLLETDRLDSVTLLDGQQRLEQELGRPGPAEVRQARRLAFGDEVAELLFSRQEAIERYRSEIAAIQIDPHLDSGERAEQVRACRERLAVELAAEGSYVGFADETRAKVEAELLARDGERLQDASEAELREAVRQACFERLPEDVRQRLGAAGQGGRP